MTPLMALLCLGLNMGTRTPVQAGSLPKPTLRAEPGSVVPWGSSMTFWCWGNLTAQKFRLYKTGSSSHWDMQLSLKTGDKAKLFVSYITEVHAGTYYCYYGGHTSWSDGSDLLELVVTGRYSKPSLSVLPSPVVASGGNVILQCGSWLGFDTFVLTQEGDRETHRKFASQQLNGQHQALFTVGPVTPRHRWLFRCYGHYSRTPQLWSPPSDTLQLQVSGATRRPSLLSPQGPFVTPGQTLTLQCHSEVAYDILALSKEGGLDLCQVTSHHTQAGSSQANFTMDSVSIYHGGQYHCYGGQGHPPMWSEPSDPLDILVAGQFLHIPALSVEPGPTVSPGDNVTLLCLSRGWRDTFLLAKEGAADPPLRIKVGTTEDITQAQFSFHPVNSTHNGTYRCYSSNSISPYRLSHPSAPLLLRVSGPSANSKTMSMAGVDPLLIGLSTAGALLSLLLLLLFLLLFRRHCQAGHHKSRATHSAPQDTGLNTRSRPGAHIQENSPDATITHTETEEGVQLNPRSRQDEDPHEATYVQVKHAGLRREVASSTPFSEVWLNAQDQQTEEDTQAGGQAEAPEPPLEVTYAQLKHLDTAQESTAPPPSLSGEPPEEPSVYAALAFH